MYLRFERRHLSIVAFPEVELPGLTIIIGLNGSGKTHLLQAIQSGAISNSLIPVLQNGPVEQKDIMLLSQGVQTLSLMQPYNSPAGNAPEPLLHRHIGIDELRRSRLEVQYTKLMEATGGRLSDILAAGEDAWRLGPEEIAIRAGEECDPQQIASIFAEAEAAFREESNPGVVRHLGNQRAQEAATLQRIVQVADKLGIRAIEVTATQLKMFEPWGTIEQFSTNLPMLFGRYRDANVRNGLLKLEDEKTGSKKSISDKEFLERFGYPPWDQINETLKTFNLPYEVKKTDLFNFDPVHFNLIRTDNQEQVVFSNLSSGEKVLFQFAISSYSYDEHFTNVVRPKMLLLDEMDASLHPEMVHRWLGAIQHGLVEGQGMHCILTTHSPTTVALAPEAALFEMIDGCSGLTKISKQDALNKLTFGVPTLSIDYSGRRQVFAESDTDAASFERVYSLIKASINCERELNFLSTGMRTKDGGEINSGCTIVTGIVDRLKEAGNQSVFGIVDWDGTATSTARIKVIAEGVRDGIENVLLDPLLICLLLTKIRRAPEQLKDIDRFSSADTLSAFDLQRMADAIQGAAIPNAIGERVEVSYLGGATSNVFRDYLTMDDHALEDALRNAFPALKKWSNRGALVTAVIDEVLTEHRVFCPVEFKAIFEEIANAQI